MIDLYTKPNCKYCTEARILLDRNDIAYNVIYLTDETMINETKESFPSATTVPIVVVDDQYIGGYKELKALVESRQLLVE